MPETTVPVSEWAAKCPPIFARCVDREVGIRFDLTRPFVRGDHLHATDGHIVVRMPTPADWPFENAKFIPGAAIVDHFAGGMHEAEPVEIPAVEGSCKTCEGAGHRAAGPCPECDGDGEVEVDCDCPNCDGMHDCETCFCSGRIEAGPCPDCDGAGVERPMDSVAIAPGYLIARYYAALIRSHGAVAYLPVDRKGTLRFVAGAVEGRLMPMASERSDGDA